MTATAGPDSTVLGIIGGTGPEGRGLALRLAIAGRAIIVGSRSTERGVQTADELRAQLATGMISGNSNARAAEGAALVILTIPYAGIEETLLPLRDALIGKIVVSAIAPLQFHDGRLVGLRPEAGSAAQEVQTMLPEARVVSAFQTIDAHSLAQLDNDLDTDVIVCSDDADARHAVVELANLLPGVRALSGGRLAAARYVEECTALLITINRIYKTHSGLRITNVDR